MILLRAAVAADRPALIDLWAEAWTATMPEIDFEARRSWFASHLESLVAAGAALLVGVDTADRPLGFVTVDPTLHEMEQLVVSPQAQGNGLGRRLVQASQVLSPGELRLTVNSQNARAIRFYERAGFERVGEGINPRSGLPVLHMRWRPTAPSPNPN